MSAITYDGISPATSVTRSQAPASATSSMMRVASSSMRGRIAWATFGMNSRATILRSAECRGGSVMSIIW